MITQMLRDDGVRLPGARRQKLTATARAHGVQLSDAQLAELMTLAGVKKIL